MRLVKMLAILAAVMAITGCGVYRSSANEGTPVHFSGTLEPNQAVMFDVSPAIGVDFRVTGPVTIEEQ